MAFYEPTGDCGEPIEIVLCNNVTKRLILRQKFQFLHGGEGKILIIYGEHQLPFRFLLR